MMWAYVEYFAGLLWRYCRRVELTIQKVRIFWRVGFHWQWLAVRSMAFCFQYKLLTTVVISLIHSSYAQYIYKIIYFSLWSKTIFLANNKKKKNHHDFVDHDILIEDENMFKEKSTCRVLKRLLNANCYLSKSFRIFFSSPKDKFGEMLWASD